MTMILPEYLTPEHPLIPGAYEPRTATPMTAAQAAISGDQALMTCPSCHVTDAAMTQGAITSGADWHCARCGQQWNALRLATTAAYAEWVSARQA